MFRQGGPVNPPQPQAHLVIEMLERRIKELLEENAILQIRERRSSAWLQIVYRFVKQALKDEDAQLSLAGDLDQLRIEMLNEGFGPTAKQ